MRNVRRLTCGMLSLSLLGLLLALALPVAPSALAAGDVNEGSCPNEANTGFSAELPDCRAYEQVSPVFKNGFPMGLENILGEGERVSSSSIGLFAGAVAGQCPNEFYEMARTSTGWVTTAAGDVPQNQFVYAQRECFPLLSNEDGVTLLKLRPASGSVYERDLYLHEPGPEGALVEVGPILPRSAIPSNGPTGPGEQVENGATTFIAATPDLSHILFTLEGLNRDLPPGITSELWPGDTTQLGPPAYHISLYEYAGTENTAPRLVGVDNSGHLISDCGTVPGNEVEGHNHENVMSEDGSRVFFTAVGPASSHCAGVAKLPPVDELFARVNGGQPQSSTNAQGQCTTAGDACTVAISEPKALSSSAPDPGCTSEECIKNTEAFAPPAVNPSWRDASFEKASRDGSKVFFTSPQQLVNGATQDSNEGDGAVETESRKGCPLTTSGDNGCNLYEYDFDEDPATKAPVGLVLISKADATGVEPQVQGVAAVSEDGSHVYFVAKGELTTAPNAEGRTAITGEDNLYVNDTITGQTAFIATLATTDSYQWESHGDESPAHMNVTDDGNYLVFITTNDITAGDTSTVKNVFRYEAATGALVRISIGDEGHNGIGGASVHKAGAAAPTQISFDSDAHPAMSEDGAIVAFVSSEALVPGALSNKCGVEEGGECTQYIENVYEYRAGRLYLIGTTGAGGGEALISPSGRDIFFGTPESLVPQDTDTLNDAYDARTDGGFPAPATPAPCSGEGCQGALPAAPAFAVPGSASLTGSGNPAPSAPAPPAKSVDKKKSNNIKCKKGFVKKRAKCVKRSKAKRAGNTRGAKS